MASDNDRAIFFGGWRRQRFWTGFRHKDKRVKFRPLVDRLSGSDIRQLWVISVNADTQTYGKIQRSSHLCQKKCRHDRFRHQWACGKICLFGGRFCVESWGWHIINSCVQVNIYMMKYKWRSVFVPKKKKEMWKDIYTLHLDFMHFIALSRFNCVKFLVLVSFDSKFLKCY